MHMPIREYMSDDAAAGCAYCRNGFERLEPLHAPALQKCPRCGAAVTRQVSAPNVGGSRSGLDDRARQAGFHKLKKLGRGEYERQY